MLELTSPRVLEVRRPNYRLTALIIASALFMEQLDSTVLATALPTMARYFDVSAPHMSVALTSYLLSLAVLIPASGSVADRFGARTVFSTAIAVFTLSSILCAQAHSLGLLVVARLLQGAGGAMMIPVGRLVLLRSVDRADLISAMSWFLVPGLIGPILGPPIGGMIVTYLDWRWIFYINVPIGVLGFALTWAFIENTRAETRQAFDLWGFAALRRQPRLPAVRLRDDEPACRRSHAGFRPDRRRLRRRRGLCRLRPAGAPDDADPRSDPDAHQDVPRLGDRGVAVAHHPGRAAVPAAADDAARLRHVGGAKRPSDLRHLLRLADDEGLRRAAAARASASATC